MNTDVGTESVYSLSEALQLLEGLESALELDGHRALVDPSALLGMLGLLCWEQLLCPRGFRSLVGTLLVNSLFPTSSGLHGPLSRWAWVGAKGDLCLSGRALCRAWGRG